MINFILYELFDKKNNAYQLNFGNVEAIRVQLMLFLRSVVPA